MQPPGNYEWCGTRESGPKSHRMLNEMPCDACYEAHNVAGRVRRAFYKVYPEKIPADAHGTPRGYQVYSCREPCCAKAWALYTRSRRKSSRRWKVSNATK